MGEIRQISRQVLTVLLLLISASLLSSCADFIPDLSTDSNSNTPPELTAPESLSLTINTGLNVVELDSGIIKPENLVVKKDGVSPSDIVYYIVESTVLGTLSLSQANSDSENLEASIELRLGDSFTQEDINQSRLSYLCDDRDSLQDSFVFMVVEPGGEYIENVSFVLTVSDTVEAEEEPEEEPEEAPEEEEPEEAPEEAPEEEEPEEEPEEEEPEEET